ncbi:ydfJ, partial [Symbiodinium sp. KB8]
MGGPTAAGRYVDPRTGDGLLAVVEFVDMGGGDFYVDARSIAICNEYAARTVRAATVELARPDLPAGLRAEMQACLARTRVVVPDVGSGIQMADATQTPQRELELRMSTFLYRLGKFSVRNRRLVLIGWLLAFVAIAVGSVAAGGETSDEFTIPGTESQQAFDLLDERFPSQSGTSGQIVFATEDGSQLIDSQGAVADTLAEAAELDGVIFVSDPFTSGAVSQDGTIGYATVRYDLETPEVGIEGVEHLIETGAIGESQGLQ